MHILGRFNLISSEKDSNVSQNILQRYNTRNSLQDSNSPGLKDFPKIKNSLSHLVCLHYRMVNTLMVIF